MFKALMRQGEEQLAILLLLEREGDSVFSRVQYCHNPNSTSTQLKSWGLNENDFRPPQISYKEIILRQPLDISLIDNRISHYNQYFQGSSFIYCSNQL